MKLNDRIRSLLTREDAETALKIRKIGPFVLFATLIAFILFGAASFWHLENYEGARAFRQYYLKLAVDRRQFARETSQRIFNDTKNLFVIMDIEQSNRVQAQLVNSLREYERHLDLPRPAKSDWEFASCLSYAWGLVTTLGHSKITPRTAHGEVFAFFFSLVGVPLFIITIAALAHGGYSLLKAKCRKPKHLYALFGGAIAVYLLLLFGYIIFLYDAGIVETFGDGIFLIALTALTIHTASYTNLSDYDKILTLFIISLSFIIGTIVFFAGRNIWKHHIATAANDKPEQPVIPSEPQRFQVVVDQSGETKLQTATSE